MQDILAASLRQLKRTRARRMRMIAIVLALSLVVSLDVFWVLRQPGLTLAGDADCRITEHTHDEKCQNDETQCDLAEHIHTVECYADETADVESQLDWQAMFDGYPYTGNLREDLVGIAKSQVGYSESTLNFAVDDEGIRHGYTRYGAWYGAPYNNWSAIFVSYCLHYARANGDEYPGNIGAASMAELWKKLEKYAAAGTYDPVPGDLVFFTDNRVGIVAEVQNATIYVICGDVNDAVQADIISLADPSITGWGITAEPTPEEETTPDTTPEEETTPDTTPEEETTPDTTPEEETTPDTTPEEETTPDTTPEEETTPDTTPEEETTPDTVPEEETTPDTEPPEETFPDLSNGPVFIITEGGKAPARPMTYSLRPSRTMAIDGEAKDIVAYLPGRGGNYYITLMDSNHHELPKDANGNYIAEANTTYRLVISFNSPNGFEAGTYEYQFPLGAVVTGGNGKFILRDDTNVGTWIVTDSGLVSMTFNEDIEDRSEITISASMDVVFPETEGEIDFDGKIKVTVVEKPEEVIYTKLTKWGSQGVLIVDPDKPTNKTDTSKIYWTIQIEGNQDSNIPGSVLTDRIIQPNPKLSHQYTDSDMDAGISFGASVKEENGNATAWHKWTVKRNEIAWDANGWTYTMPETQTCEICGNTFALGNEGWTYYVEYSSTPNHTDIAGQLEYNNQVDIDNQTVIGTAYFSHRDVSAAVFKQGKIISDASGSKYLWEIQVTIPGRKDPSTVDLTWYLNDEISIGYIDSYGKFHRETWVDNNLLNATITANYYGTTINVPNIHDATEKDPYAWALAWEQGENGITYGHNIYLLCRCKGADEVLADGVPHWPYSEWVNGVEVATDYCTYWTEIEDTTFTFTYTTDDFDAIGKYAQNGNVLQNVARLSNAAYFGIKQDGAAVTIPTMITKEDVISDDEQYPHYTITVNEAKLTLTDGSPLLITDVMTDTLAYIKGSMVIVAEDVNGNTWELYQDKDFTVNYYVRESQDGTGHHSHVIDITILHPQPVKYTLDYDTEIIWERPEDIENGQIKYSNEATVTLWGKPVTASTTEKTFASLNMSTRAYKIELYKVAADTQLPLGGATFGLFNEHGVLITEKTTNYEGKLVFETNTAQGIILRQHQLYYVQELRAPPGYQLDNTKHWLCFCNDEGESCSEYKEALEGVNAVRIPLNQNGNLQLENKQTTYALPSTGGIGIYPVILVGVLLTMIPLVYISIRRRKRERRDAG